MANIGFADGPPGTGKTLTAEGISELLKCPLYMVSAGELGTDPRYLETELLKILDICHTWGAILLLDEADVFLERRSLHDIHRNSLVGVFLRQLEYFMASDDHRTPSPFLPIYRFTNTTCLAGYPFSHYQPRGGTLYHTPLLGKQGVKRLNLV